MTVLLMVITLLCLIVPFYVYFGYPLLLWLLTARLPAVTHHREDLYPDVTLIISCFNEEAVIRRKLENALATNYPADRLKILAVSDGSTDSTDDIVREFSAQGVKLIRQEGRLGKTMGLNLALEHIDTEIVVFSDANAMYDRDAIAKLVRNFADASVGYVVGAALYTDGKEGASASNEDLYWRYEIAIKTMESRLHSVVGGDGAIYAIRKALWEPLQQRDINDFVNPLQIIAKGYRGVFDPDARCFEETAGSFDKEIARKERIVNRSIRGLMRVRELLNPFRFGIFTFEVVSHKLLRWLIPLFMALGVAGSALLVAQGYLLFAWVLCGAMAIVLFAMLGHLKRADTSMPAFLSIPYYFVMVNLFALRGILKAMRGETQVTWSSARPGEVASKEQSDTQGIFWYLTALGLMGVSLLIGFSG